MGVLSRREFLRASMFAGIGVLAFQAGREVLAYPPPKLEYLNLTDERIGDEFDGYKIGFISDIHLGPTLDEHYLERCYRMMAKENVNIVLFGGDYIWNPRHSVSYDTDGMYENISDRSQYARDIFRRCAVICRDCISAQDGFFAVFGNHDRWEGSLECQEEFKRNGIRLLVNEWVEIRKRKTKILICGVDDYWTGYPKIPYIATDDSAYRILISHNPDFVAENVKTNRHIDLALCGHTHGGQIKFPLIGALGCNVKNTFLIEGLHRVENTLVYTNRGIGTVEIPIRLNSDPEITIITLNKSV